MTDPTPPPGTPPPFPTDPPPFQLTGQEQALYNALFKRDERLAIFYRAAVMVFRSSNPDRFALAAHDIRELMEKIHLYLQLPVPRAQDNLGNQVTVLIKEWGEMRRKSMCRAGGSWSGEIDRPLAKWLLRYEEFLVWKETYRPVGEARTATIIREIDVGGVALPGNIEALRVKEWADSKEFFVEVSHHKRTTSESEFQAYLSNMERFLLDRLSPRTFSDQKNIADIVQEGEDDAQT